MSEKLRLTISLLAVLRRKTSHLLQSLFWNALHSPKRNNNHKCSIYLIYGLLPMAAAMELEISKGLWDWTQNAKTKGRDEMVSLPKFVFQFRQPLAHQSNSFILLLNFSEVSLKLHSGSIVKWKIYTHTKMRLYVQYLRAQNAHLLLPAFHVNELIGIKRTRNNIPEQSPN